MPITACRANCLDASALVKLYVNECGSDILQQYLQHEPTYYTTLFCYFETLSVLKRKWLYGKNGEDEITQEEYREATFSLTAWFSLVSQKVKDLDFTSLTVFSEVQRISKDHKLDLSDAFQILSVKQGFFSPLAGESRTILVTADKNLATVARKEGLRAWNLLSEPTP